MLKIPKFTFPVVFEWLIWLFYVGIYKYSYFVEQSDLPHIPETNFPYPEICAYGFAVTLYLIPYYRRAVPKMLESRRYGLLLISTIVLLLFFSIFNNAVIARLFMGFTNGPLHHYFNLHYKARYVDFNLLLTDFLAFSCLAFARYSYHKELINRLIETDHLKLQISMLKSQLHPHFLFNTLNGLYGISLTHSEDTPRYILILSQMMQYILYDCDQDYVEISDEIDFIKGYFELEQKKFPAANISFKVNGIANNIKIPPLLFLPLIENSFKHGRHKLIDHAEVNARLTVYDDHTEFIISNDVLPEILLINKEKKGGIGLANLHQRLNLYYSGHRHQMTVLQNEHTYSTTLILKH
ncbi:sensor histidine kinase [Chryseobacterium sp. Leaf201]|uniref:sensor histidine kinase n=1 Tax=Chryseobacterium sp. Leaf201 TaxID=1735672 RepID=UPI0007022B1A|nr:histidine kinase [Chryseobacterium sp. Leaf201]KQM47068.1 hypothetical protein ASE55_10730 [Chryseobacterium sp. Leaf201]